MRKLLVICGGIVVVSVLVALHHITSYKYDRPVSLGPQIVRLRPAPHSRTAIPSYSLKVSPAKHFINWQQDPHGNWLARFVFPEPTNEFRVEVDLTAKMSVINPFDFFVEPYAEEFPFAYSDDLRADLAAYLTPEPMGRFVSDFIAGLSKEKQRTVPFLVALNEQLRSKVRYLIRMEPGVQSPDDTLALGVRFLPRFGVAAGSDCAKSWPRGALRLRLSDSAQGRCRSARRPEGHRQGLLRSARLGRNLYSGRRLDRTGRDVRSALRRRSYSALGDAALSLRRAHRRKSRAPANCTFSFDMRVDRIHEAPRVTKPFSDETWAKLDMLGDAVDRDLVVARCPPHHGRRADLRFDR